MSSCTSREVTNALNGEFCLVRSATKERQLLRVREKEMAKRPSAKNIFRLVTRYGVAKYTGTKIEMTPAALARLRKQKNELMADCLAQAFTEAGLDHETPEHWKRLAIWLAVSVYAGRDGPGRPTHWTKQRMERLIDDFDRTAAERIAKGLPAAQLACCVQLLKVAPYSNLRGKNYKPLTASGLNRRLQRAREMKAALKTLEQSK